MRHALGLLMGSILFSPLLVHAGTINNGGFETGNFSGWQTIGAASVVDSSFGSPPSQGLFQALLSNGKGSVANFDNPVLANFLGATSGPANKGVNGSGILTTVNVQSGDVLTFDWKFLTDEFATSLPGSYPDFAVFVVDGVSTSLIQLPMFDGRHGVWSSTPANFHVSDTDFSDETDWNSTRYQFNQSGFHTIGFGVLNAFDDRGESAIVLDNFRFDSLHQAALAVVPLPPALYGGSALLGTLLSIRFLRRRQSLDR